MGRRRFSTKVKSINSCACSEELCLTGTTGSLLRRGENFDYNRLPRFATKANNVSTPSTSLTRFRSQQQHNASSTESPPLFLLLRSHYEQSEEAVASLRIPIALLSLQQSLAGGKP